MTYLSTVTITPSAALTTMTDPETGHRMIMEFWPDVPTRESQGARATVGALWSTQTVTPHDGTILLRSQIRPALLPIWVTKIDTTEEKHTFATGQPVSGSITLTTVKTPRVLVPEHLRSALKTGANGSARPAGEGLCYRAAQVPVPETAIPEWVKAKLGRQGLAVNAEITSIGALVLQQHHNRYPTATVRFQGTVTEPALAANAMAKGIGKAKAFGVGMIVLTPG